MKADIFSTPIIHQSTHSSHQLFYTVQNLVLDAIQQILFGKHNAYTKIVDYLAAHPSIQENTHSSLMTALCSDLCMNTITGNAVGFHSQPFRVGSYRVVVVIIITCYYCRAMSPINIIIVTHTRHNNGNIVPSQASRPLGSNSVHNHHTHRIPILSTENGFGSS